MPTRINRKDCRCVGEEMQEKMADEATRNKSFAKRGNGNPGLRMLDSLYYEYARIK